MNDESKQEDQAASDEATTAPAEGAAAPTTDENAAPVDEKPTTEQATPQAAADDDDDDDFPVAEEPVVKEKTAEQLAHEEALRIAAEADAEAGDDDDDDEEEVVDSGAVEPLELVEEEPESVETNWYILKVQVNREDSIRDALIRRVKMHGLDDFFEEIIVPTEDVVEFTKTGRKRTVKRKLYPGYIMVKMAITDESWFLVRETSGIGDFTGSAGKPTPMDPVEVDRIIAKPKDDEEEETGPRVDIPFNPQDRVRVKDGNFLNFEGEVESVDATHGRVTVIISIFGRPTPVELEHWQIEAM